MKTTVISSFVVFVFLFYACSKKSEDSVTPPVPNPGNCDTVNMKYMADVVPILQANCYTCHSSANSGQGNGIVLEGHANLKIKAQSGELLGAITHASGYTPMPYNGGQLSECNINKIRSWLAHGMQDN